MIRKFLITAILITLISGCAFADIDLGEGYHVPEIFSSVLITNSDGKAIQNTVERIQDGGTILLSGNINIKKNITLKGDNDKAILDGTLANITLENLIIQGGNYTNGGGYARIETSIFSGDIDAEFLKLLEYFSFTLDKLILSVQSSKAGEGESEFIIRFRVK